MTPGDHSRASRARGDRHIETVLLEESLLLRDLERNVQHRQRECLDRNLRHLAAVPDGRSEARAARTPAAPARSDRDRDPGSGRREQISSGQMKRTHQLSSSCGNYVRRAKL